MPVIQQENFNQATLINNDVYVVVVRPTSTSVQGIPTGYCGVTGTASWGPMGAAVPAGSPGVLAENFGPLANKVNDAVTAALVLLRAGVPRVYVVRGSDGTHAKATAPMVTAATGSVALGGTFKAGDIVTVTVAGNAVPYTLVAGDTNLAGAAASIAAALNANATFKAGYEAFVASGSTVTIESKTTTAATLTAAVTGTTPTTTATASGATLTAGGASMGTWNARFDGTEGNNISRQVVVGSNSTPTARTWTVILQRNGVFSDSEVFENIPQATFATTLSNALANGQSSRRPASNLARFTADVGAGAPVQTSATFAGGLNGDTSVLTDAQLLGTDLGDEPTGIYALKGKGVQHVLLAGNTNSTSWVPLRDFAKKEGMIAYSSFPAGTTTSAAVALKKSAGINNEYIVLDKDFWQFNDTYNGVLRMLPPSYPVMAKRATLNPNESIGNKEMPDIMATERSLAKREYGPDEIAELTKNGIGIINNPCPGGAYWGRIHGLNTCTTNNQVEGTEYTAMTNFLAYSCVNGFGEFIDKVQTTSPKDPVRQKAYTKLNNFFNGLNSGAGKLLDGYNVDMGFGDGKVNTKQSVEDGFLIAEVKAKYMSVIRKFVIRLVGGKSVEVSLA